MQNIETNVIIEGYQIEACIEDYVQDAGLVRKGEELADYMRDSLSDHGVLTADDQDAIWNMIDYYVDDAIGNALGDYFSYGNGSDDISRAIENDLPDWLRAQLTDMPDSEGGRCDLGKAFTQAVNTVVKTTDTNVEWATKVEALEARVYALEEVIYSMHNTWKDLNPHNDEPHPARNGRSEREKYAVSVAKITEALS
jgi:hypothetical protein